MSLTALLWVISFWFLAVYNVMKLHEIARSLEKIANNTREEAEAKLKGEQ